MNQTTAFLTIQKYTAAIDHLSSAVAAAGIFLIRYHLILEPLCGWPPGECFKLLSAALEPGNIFEVNIDTVLTADVTTEGAAHAVHVVGEQKDSRVNMLHAWYTGAPRRVPPT